MNKVVTIFRQVPPKCEKEIAIQGAFINDVMQVGLGGLHYCDTVFEGPSWIGILVRQRGRGVRKNMRDVIYEGPPVFKILTQAFAQYI